MYFFMKKKSLLVQFRKQIGYQFLVWPALIFTVIFCYIPMGGLLIAFKDYKLRTGILRSAWSGLSNFRNIFDDFYMPSIITNTVAISIIGIVAAFPIVIGFALLLNEVGNSAFKRVVQTVSYLPHFISWAIMTVILTAMFSASSGVVNELLLTIGILKKPLIILTDRNSYWGMAVFSGIWKEMGWSAIVYLAVIAGIDPTLYEAAKVDGAGRLARAWHITLPSLKGIIAIMLILSVSSMPGVGFEQAYFLSNNVNIERANTLTYYIYTTGIIGARFSYSTAIGLILSIISAILMIVANTTSRRLTGRGLY
jgi:putative aldouronate transport system permease protein